MVDEEGDDGTDACSTSLSDIASEKKMKDTKASDVIRMKNMMHTEINRYGKTDRSCYKAKAKVCFERWIEVGEVIVSSLEWVGVPPSE